MTSFASTFEIEQKVNRCHRRCVIGKVTPKRRLGSGPMVYWPFGSPIVHVNFRPGLPNGLTADQIRADLDKLRRNIRPSTANL